MVYYQKYDLGELGLTSHLTHYRSYRGQDFIGQQQCQSTEGREGL